jgi:hypothetical protein
MAGPHSQGLRPSHINKPNAPPRTASGGGRADQAERGYPASQVTRTRAGQRPATGYAGNRKAAELQVVGQGRDVKREVLQRGEA